MTIFPIAGVADWIDADGNPLYFFYEQLADVCTRCSDIMVLFAFVVIFAGTAMQVSKGIFGGDLSSLFKHLVLVGLAVSIMPHYAEWFLELQKLLGEDLLVALEVDPLSMLINFGESFAEEPFDTGSAPSIVFGVLDPLTWFEYFAKILGGFCMVVISVFMYVCFYVGFQVQIMAIYLGCAAGPLFIAMLLFEPTRDSAVKYHVGMVGICFWPLGWGLGMLFGEAMFEAGLPLINSILYVFYLASIATGMMGGFIVAAVAAVGMLIIALIVIAWFLVTLFGAPKVVQKAVTSGAQIGMSLIQGGISTSTTLATSAVSAGVQAASGAAMAAGGAALAVGTGGAGAAIGGGMIASGAGSMVGSVGTAAGGVASAAQAASKAADNN